MLLYGQETDSSEKYAVLVLVVVEALIIGYYTFAFSHDTRVAAPEKRVSTPVTSHTCITPANDPLATEFDYLSTHGNSSCSTSFQGSIEKGPCCCQCWRWHAYGGVAKYLIQTYHFAGPQLTEVWNVSDGCGADS